MLRGWLVSILLLLALAACKPREDADAVAVDDEATMTQEEADESARFDLIASLGGVWASTDQTAAGRPETVYMLGHVVDTHMDITRDGIGLDVLTEDVDPLERTATFYFRESPVKERLTFQLVPSPEGVEGGGYDLRVTYADGRYQTLRPVRRLTRRDMDQMNEALEVPMLSTAIGDVPPAAKPATANFPSRVDCSNGTDFRSRTVCKDEGLRGLDRRLAALFDALRARNVDASTTQAAASKQLDACSSGECLQKAYGDWLKYIDENYPQPSAEEEEGDYR